MGCFPCFDSREDEKLNPEKEPNDQKQGQPTVSNNISRLPSGKFCSFALLIIYFSVFCSYYCVFSYGIN